MIKRAVVGLVIGTVLVCSVLSAGVPLNNKHKDIKGKDDAAVNCGYCHEKAGNPKTKGNDLEKIKKGEYCSLKDCHG